MNNTNIQSGVDFDIIAPATVRNFTCSPDVEMPETGKLYYVYGFNPRDGVSKVFAYQEIQFQPEINFAVVSTKDFFTIPINQPVVYLESVQGSVNGSLQIRNLFRLLVGGQIYYIRNELEIFLTKCNANMSTANK